MAKFDSFIAVSCTPCDRSMWQAMASEKYTPEKYPEIEELFCGLRKYKTAEEVPCCSDNWKLVRG